MQHYILNDCEHLGKFDTKHDQVVFLGYSNNRAYLIYNIRSQSVIKSANVVMDGHNDFSKFSKEHAINSFIDEAFVESILDKQVKEPAYSIAIEIGSKQSSGRKFVAIETYSLSVMTDNM